jgi:mono/diheme cytochrome c family protein
MRLPLVLLTSLLAALSFFAASNLPGADPADQTLRQQFTDSVQPFLRDNCFQCHGAAKEESGKLDLSTFTSVDDVTKSLRRWETILKRVEAGEMPPDDAKHQPTAEDRQKIVQWIRTVRKQEIEEHAGDPGPVLARRLSNAEYDYTIRDLTGVEIRPAQEFPVDPANEAGFDNSGESLTMSPALLKKYLAAARQVSEYVVLKPHGFEFAPHPVVTDTDRDKYCVKRIIQFYQRQPTDLADYFLAAWQFQNRASIGKPDATLADFATAGKLSAKYLEMVWLIIASPDEVGPIAKLQAMWHTMPAPPGNSDPEPVTVKKSCREMRDWVIDLREKLQPKWANLQLKGIGAGSQPFVLWKDQQFATHRRTYNHAALQIEGEANSGLQIPIAKSEQPEFPNGNEDQKPITTKPAPRDPDLTIPADPNERAHYESAFERFASTFPDAFYISERGRIFLDRPKEKQDKGRLLSAGFHSMMGYFRDDIPLCELILDDDGHREIDELWDELDFITLAPQRQHTGYIWYERAESSTIRRWGTEFDVFRSEDKDITSESKIKQFAALYLAKARESFEANGGDAVALEVLDNFFKHVNSRVRWLEKSQLDAEPSHLDSLLKFAQRAYRRPLSEAERDDLLAFYHELRSKDGLTHEDALRDTVASVLMSPNFCFRLDFDSKSASESSAAPQPLSDYDLANRLSYFLWSSMPDEELLSHAVAGDLHNSEVLTAQARRMVRDDRARGLATEFGANWLDFRRFQQQNTVDRERFPSFTNDLRDAMFEEPIRFFLNVLREDRSVLDFLYADYAIVNPILAKHYGMPDPKTAPDEWTRVEGAARYKRGGLLPMSVFLTANSPGLRTSPVKRGYWVVRRLLGEQIPPPPPKVPVLPTDESKLGDLTLAQTLAAHRADKSCAACHARFDSLGLVFEGYGPIGEARDKDLAGHPVDTSATFPDGNDRTGLAGLRNYIRDRRQDDFLDNLCRKLLSYGLGRTLIPSDDPLVDTMRAKLETNNYHFSTLIETIITSPQFLTKRAS